MTSQKTILGMMAAAMVLGAGSAAQATTYVSGNGSAPGVTYLTTSIALAPGNTGSTPGDAGHNAFVITGSQVPSAYGQLGTGSNAGLGNANAQWLTGFVDGSGNAANGDYNTDYLFTQDFTVSNPSNGSLLLTGNALSDNDLLSITIKDLTNNISQVLYSNPSVAGQDGSASYTSALSFGDSGNAPSGNYALVFDVHNQHNIGQPFNPIALEDSFTVAPVPEPGTIASFAFGGFGLLGLMLRARKAGRASA